MSKMKLLTIICIFLLAVSVSADISPTELKTISPFYSKTNVIDNSNLITTKMQAGTYQAVKENVSSIIIDIPLPDKEPINAVLERFEILTPSAQFYFGNNPTEKPTAVLYRGTLDDDPNSLIFMSFTDADRCNGLITLSSGERYIISEGASSSDQYQQQLISIQKETQLTVSSDIPDFCGVGTSGRILDNLKSTTLSTTSGTPAELKLAKIAIEADSEFVALFDNTVDAQNYAYQMLGAVSSIYVRDLNVRLVIDFLRLWPAGGEPFSSYSLGEFSDYWYNNENPYEYNIVHLLSGHRDLSFGGIAYVSGTCPGNAFSISGYLNGSFPSSLDTPDQGAWDIIVSAHEMGHNFGTFHTHDITDYDPIIDSCAQGYPVEGSGTIMSYCHIHPGYTSNSEVRFHGRVIEFLENYIAGQDCLETDCNENGIADFSDIANLTSADANSNGVPDECEDCNANDTLDNIDISTNGYADINSNGIPDICDLNCNDNIFPDAIEINPGVNDQNYNGLLDVCEPDCNSNGIPDFIEIRDGLQTDYDRNLIPDNCQDCNANDTIDWIELQSEHHLYTADLGGHYIREYHRRSGVPIQNLGAGNIASPYDIIFGDDNMMYIANYTVNTVTRINPETNSSTVFINNPSVLTGPSALLFNDAGLLYVASLTSSAVFRFDSNGLFVDTFIAPGSNGLSSPFDMVLGPNGNLFITSNDNRIMEFNSITGAFIGDFVSAGSGGLSDPHGLTFIDTRLLVTSYATNIIIEYSSADGSYIRQFSDLYDLENPWGIQVGPNGDVYVARNGSTPRVIEYNPVGRYYRSFVRGDDGMTQTSAIAFRPTSDLDCNGNYQLDACDIALGILTDANTDGVPDECVIGDIDNDGIADNIDNCINTPNPGQEDNNFDGIGNACCCIGSTGNVDLSASEAPDISDLLLLVDYMFLPPGTVEIGCPHEGNIDSLDEIDISDLLLLVDYMFIPANQIVLPDCL